MFDAWPEPGGVLLYGIPNFKMSKEILDDYLNHLWDMGVKFVGNTWIGKDVTIDELFAPGLSTRSSSARREPRQPARHAGRGASGRLRWRRSSWCAATCARSSFRASCGSRSRRRTRCSSSAAATRRWTACARRCGSARKKSPASTGAPRRSSWGAKRSASTRAKRACTSSTWPRRVKMEAGPDGRIASVNIRAYGTGRAG